MYKFILLILTIIAIQSCSVSDKDIKSQGWKLSDVRQSSNPTDSLRTGRDVLDFRGYMSLKGDTIYRGNSPYAIIVDRKYGISLFESNSIEVVDLLTQDTLRYVAKW